MQVTEEQKIKFYVDGFIVFENLIDFKQIKLLANQSDLIGNNKKDKVPITSTQLEPDLNNLKLVISTKFPILFCFHNFINNSIPIPSMSPIVIAIFLFINF